MDLMEFVIICIGDLSASFNINCINLLAAGDFILSFMAFWIDSQSSIALYFFLIFFSDTTLRGYPWFFFEIFFLFYHHNIHIIVFRKRFNESKIDRNVLTETKNIQNKLPQRNLINTLRNTNNITFQHHHHCHLYHIVVYPQMMNVQILNFYNGRWMSCRKYILLPFLCRRFAIS